MKTILLLLCCVSSSLLAQGNEKLTFEKTTVDLVAAGKVEMTRATLSGNVTYVSKEADGDIHIRVCDSAKVNGMDAKHCVVCEIMPCYQSKIAAPKVGQQVTVQGITRFDAEHKWWELHPVESVN